MKRVKILLPVLLLAAGLALGSCYKEEPIDPDKVYVNLGGESWAESDLDKWLYENFTKPYNIEVRYKWSYLNGERQYLLTPVDETVVEPAMLLFKRTLLDAYEEYFGPDGGSTFLKTVAPKTLILMGSVGAQQTKQKLAEAAGGIRISIWGLNRLLTTDAGYKESVIRSTIHFMHHEFAHTLHQKKMYPVEFQTLTPGLYITNWETSSNATANSLGFVSAYARASSNEDFVETYAYILNQGKAAFDALVASAPAEARTALLAKESTIVEYLKHSWDIDLYDIDGGTGLTTIVQTAIGDVIAEGIGI